LEGQLSKQKYESLKLLPFIVILPFEKSFIKIKFYIKFIVSWSGHFLCKVIYEWFDYKQKNPMDLIKFPVNWREVSIAEEDGKNKIEEGKGDGWNREYKGNLSAEEKL
jgi:hypothetical protein